MTISEGPGGVGTRIISGNYPVDEGLTLGTTKLKDNYILRPQEEDLTLDEEDTE